MPRKMHRICLQGMSELLPELALPICTAKYLSLVSLLVHFNRTHSFQLELGKMKGLIP